MGHCHGIGNTIAYETAELLRILHELEWYVHGHAHMVKWVIIPGDGRMLDEKVLHTKICTQLRYTYTNTVDNKPRYSAATSVV